MKPFFRIFFKTLRVIIGPFMLLWELLTRPKGTVRPPALQERLDQECRSLALYQYRTCPFCIKVRQELHRLSLRVDYLDAQPAGNHREALVRGGGRAKVPCLRITDQAGNSQWLYESGEIIRYLRGRFAAV